MNRKLEFRTWCIREGYEEMNYLYETDDFGNSREFYPWVMEIGFTNDWTHKDFIFMQFTGLEDSKKKKIFEGDIITYGGEMYLIVFQDYGWMMERILPKDFVVESIFQTHWQMTHNSFLYSVIGNMFENPELLK